MIRALVLFALASCIVMVTASSGDNVETPRTDKGDIILNNKVKEMHKTHRYRAPRNHRGIKLIYRKKPKWILKNKPMEKELHVRDMRKVIRGAAVNAHRVTHFTATRKPVYSR